MADNDRADLPTVEEAFDKYVAPSTGETAHRARVRDAILHVLDTHDGVLDRLVDSIERLDQ